MLRGLLVALTVVLVGLAVGWGRAPSGIGSPGPEIAQPTPLAPTASLEFAGPASHASVQFVQGWQPIPKPGNPAPAPKPKPKPKAKPKPKPAPKPAPKPQPNPNPNPPPAPNPPPGGGGGNNGLPPGFNLPPPGTQKPPGHPSGNCMTCHG